MRQVTDWTDPDLDQFLPSAGSKQNLAHLLNAKFQLAPRESTTPYWRATHSEGSGRRHHGHYSTRGHFNKDSYLQAKYVVGSSRVYRTEVLDGLSFLQLSVCGEGRRRLQRLLGRS